MKAALRRPQRVIRSSEVGGDTVAWVWVAAESWNGGCSFIKHLQDNLPSLHFSSIKNVPPLLLDRRRL